MSSFKTFFLFFILFFGDLAAQDENIRLVTENGTIDGTLRLPAQKKNLTLVILHSGSGPTDRNGNQGDAENNSLKYVADILASAGIASLRYDKRGVAESKSAVEDESDLRIEVYVNDLKLWIHKMGKDARFNKIILAGHSEGSLIAMMAARDNKKVKAFISVAGAGQPADEVLKEQFSKAPDEVKNSLFNMLERVKKGDTIENVPPIFYMLLHPSVQPYIRSWFKYDPAAEISKLNIPVLVVNGTTDIQVGTKNAEILSKACKTSELKLIKDMNHVLKECPSMERSDQLPFYEDPAKPLHPEFSAEILKFCTGIK